MLTPNGLGKEFRVKNKPYRPPKRRRARRRVIFLVVVVVLGTGGWSTYRYVLKDDTKTTAAAVCTQPTAKTTSQPVTTAQPGQVTLNVYNDTNRVGLAAGTAAALGQRGFTHVNSANDPIKEVINGPAVVRAGAAGKAAQLLVLAEVQGAVAATDNRPDASVDLVLGNGFVALRDPAAVAAALTPSPAPAPLPVVCHAK